MKWKPKDDHAGVPGRGYIKAEDYNQQDEDALLARAKNRKIDVNVFMLKAGFVPAGSSQLELDVEPVKPAPALQTEVVGGEPPKEKRKRRTKAEIEAEKK